MKTKQMIDGLDVLRLHPERAKNGLLNFLLVKHPLAPNYQRKNLPFTNWLL